MSNRQQTVFEVMIKLNESKKNISLYVSFSFPEILDFTAIKFFPEIRFIFGLDLPNSSDWDNTDLFSRVFSYYKYTSNVLRFQSWMHLKPSYCFNFFPGLLGTPLNFSRWVFSLTPIIFKSVKQNLRLKLYFIFFRGNF